MYDCEQEQQFNSWNKCHLEPTTDILFYIYIKFNSRIANFYSPTYTNNVLNS